MEREAAGPSAAQLKYRKKEYLHRRRTAVCRAVLLLLFLALWELCARLGMIDAFIFSSPSGVLFCFLRMAADGSVFLHLSVTLFEALVSFGLTVTAGLAAAVLLWFSRSAAEILEPYLVMLNSLPKSALAPLLIVWLGSGMHTVVAAAVSVALFGSVLTLYNGFLSADPGQVRLIYSLGGTRRDVLTKLLLPGCVPLLVSSMKVNIGLCLVGVVIGEFLSAQSGLGYLIIYGSQVFRLDLVMMSIVLLCLLSAGLYRGIVWLEKKML